MLSAKPLATSEDDWELVTGVQSRPTAIGFFGYSYYAANRDTLKLLPVDGVAPSPQTVATGQYSLTRPLYVYTAASVLQEKPQLAGFLSYYLGHVSERAATAGFFAAPKAQVDAGHPGTGPGRWRKAFLEPGAATGDIAAAGSSTVAPLTQAVAAEFRTAGFGGDSRRGHLGHGRRLRSILQRAG